MTRSVYVHNGETTHLALQFNVSKCHELQACNECSSVFGESFLLLFQTILCTLKILGHTRHIYSSPRRQFHGIQQHIMWMREFVSDTARTGRAHVLSEAIQEKISINAELIFRKIPMPSLPFCIQCTPKKPKIPKNCNQ